VTRTHAGALRVIAERLAAREEEIARTIVTRLRMDIVSYRLVEGEPEFDEAVRFTRVTIRTFLAGLAGEDPISPELLRETRQMARQLVSQSVSLSAMLHSGRVWGATVWEAVLEATDPEVPEEREAALEIGARIWRHVDVISTTGSHAYLDEVTDRGLVSRQLLDALLAGRGDTERARRLAQTLRLRLSESHILVLVRGDDVPVEDAAERPLSTRVALDHIVEAARTRLRPESGSVLVGIRLGDVVALYPAASPSELARVRHDCEVLAASLSVDVSIGMSGWHADLAGIALAYAEAREAVQIAVGTGIRGRAVGLEDVLVDHMLLSSAHAGRMLESILRPLLEYDRAHQAELVETLRAYLAAGTSLTRSAKTLTVHPNTVVYRLRRIRELSGRDPQSMEDLLILSLALKLMELRSPQ
jgi:DNA-binding PucR family transcriptional regulator